jgi:nicotinamidase/pyrazinamidase
MEAQFTPEDALIIVDVQNDFMPDWKLPVPDGDAVVPVINHWVKAAGLGHAQVVASRDWHPADHASFKENGGPWPAHCVQHTQGAAFHLGLELPGGFKMVTKGDRPDLDPYSDFEGTSLAAELREVGVKRVFVCGLAQDVFVKATVLDALEHGFETHVVASATRPLSPVSGKLAMEEMRRAGAIIEE